MIRNIKQAKETVSDIKRLCANVIDSDKLFRELKRKAKARHGKIVKCPNCRKLRDGLILEPDLMLALLYYHVPNDKSSKLITTELVP